MPGQPWPANLPGDLPLASVMRRTSPDGFVIGLADHPDRQTQEPFELHHSDDHIALLGGPRADLNGALTTIACSAAVSASPSDLHIYGIDLSGRGLARISNLPHCGAVASRSESLALRPPLKLPCSAIVFPKDPGNCLFVPVLRIPKGDRFEAQHLPLAHDS